MLERANRIIMEPQGPCGFKGIYLKLNLLKIPNNIMTSLLTAAKLPGVSSFIFLGAWQPHTEEYFLKYLPIFLQFWISP